MYCWNEPHPTPTHPYTYHPNLQPYPTPSTPPPSTHGSFGVEVPLYQGADDMYCSNEPKPYHHHPQHPPPSPPQAPSPATHGSFGVEVPGRERHVLRNEPHPYPLHPMHPPSHPLLLQKQITHGSFRFEVPGRGRHVLRDMRIDLVAILPLSPLPLLSTTTPTHPKNPLSSRLLTGRSALRYQGADDMYCGICGLISLPSSSNSAGANPALRASSSSCCFLWSSRDLNVAG
ncbi:unnamed protein product [Closterium sp. NIES-53]